MSVLVDAGVIIGFLHRRDRLHEAAVRLLEPVLDGEAGEALTTDYIADEVFTFLVARGASAGDLDKALAFVVGGKDEPGAFRLVRVGEDDFASAATLLRKHRERRLSFTDCTSLAVLRARGLEAIATFDAGFDGLASRFGRVA